MKACIEVSFIKLVIVISRKIHMTISSPEREAKKVKIAVDRNPVETNFEKWACDLKQEFDR
jgi:hypothetical protein